MEQEPGGNDVGKKVIYSYINIATQCIEKNLCLKGEEKGGQNGGGGALI